ncbi:DJ-1 family glyoxalase III [Thiomicrospira sp. WB1]|uniref:DJ-1 family glyoxalase III n=1 Tax=Thiomicrospira sp. WB1 TaxID=1685380 RepID=UPI00074778B1|nr:DJ-1 family glyoxalase III [Thiomicrospira sp. WB1]KUJ71728.1 4-methyl-5(B-hydroxyethyl)-thiazole monophosphate biosynthesis protein [Thiomicrospira sp. WB1]
MASQSVLVPLAQGCEELEAVTLVDLLTRANLDVVTASLDTDRTIYASRGTTLVAQTTLQEVMDRHFDLIVLPGGMPGADFLRDDEDLRSLMQRQVEKDRWLAAICAAPKALVAAGLLDGRHATSFPGMIDEQPGKGMVFEDEPVVCDGKIITSQGPGTAMLFALILIEKLAGLHVREQVEAKLQLPRHWSTQL